MFNSSTLHALKKYQFPLNLYTRVEKKYTSKSNNDENTKSNY